MNCEYSDIIAIFEVQSPIDGNGVATDVHAPSEHGYNCTNCGLGFADRSGMLGHLLHEYVPPSKVGEAQARLDSFTTVEVTEVVQNDPPVQEVEPTPEPVQEQPVEVAQEAPAEPQPEPVQVDEPIAPVAEG